MEGEQKDEERQDEDEECACERVLAPVLEGLADVAHHGSNHRASLCSPRRRLLAQVPLLLVGPGVLDQQLLQQL
eukprot:672225-Pyramimonas_sp.AAC.1